MEIQRLIFLKDFSVFNLNKEKQMIEVWRVGEWFIRELIKLSEKQNEKKFPVKLFFLADKESKEDVEQKFKIQTLDFSGEFQDLDTIVVEKEGEYFLIFLWGEIKDEDEVKTINSVN